MFEKPKKENKRWKGLIYGATGVRKTRFSLSLPKPVVIDMEKGTTEYTEDFNYEVKHTTSADDVMEAVDFLLTKPHNYATLIIDPITVYWASLQKKWTDIFFERKKGKAGHKTDYYELQVGDWGVIKSEFKQFLRKIALLDMNVVFTAHEKPEYEDNGMMKKTGEYLPDCEKSIPYFFDTILRFTLNNKGETIIYTKKDRTGRLPAQFTLGDDTFLKCSGITGTASKPIEMITEVQLEELENIKIQVCSNEKYKIDETKWLSGLKKHGVDSESELTKTQADEWIEAWDKYIKKITDENEEK